MKLVSVIIPCFNHGEFIEECLESVYKQSYKNIEIIVVDDGSTDQNTINIIDRLATSKKFTLIRKVNGGLSSARNEGIRNANGYFILPLDSDYLIANNYIELAVKLFEKENDLSIVYGKARKFGVVESLWNLPKHSNFRIKFGNTIYCSALFKKGDWVAVGGYDENLKRGFEDWDFWISIIKRGGKVRKINDVMFYYRQSETSMVKKMTPEVKASIHKYVMKKHKDFFHINLPLSFIKFYYCFLSK